MTNRHLAMLAGNDKRLRFSDRHFAGGRITDMTDSAVSRQPIEPGLAENVGNQPH